MTKITAMNIPPEVKLSNEPVIHEGTIIKDSLFGRYVEIGKNNNIVESSIVDYSYTGENCQIIYSEIGKFANIASYVRLNPGQHPIHKASQHHMLYRRKMYGFGENDEEFFNQRRQSKVYIGHDTWIGHNVTIMGGVRVENGAIIGSGAIVTKDIPAYAIAVGNPAKVIKYRFESSIIDKLQKIKWWNWSHKQIAKTLKDFENIEEFIAKHGI